MKMKTKTNKKIKNKIISQVKLYFDNNVNLWCIKFSLSKKTIKFLKKFVLNDLVVYFYTYSTSSIICNFEKNKTYREMDINLKRYLLKRELRNYVNDNALIIFCEKFFKELELRNKIYFYFDNFEDAQEVFNSLVRLLNGLKIIISHVKSKKKVVLYEKD